MCMLQQCIVDEVDPILKGWITDRRAFTSHEVTQKVRRLFPDRQIEHQEVRELVWARCSAGMMGDYQTTRASLPGIEPAKQPRVFHPPGADLTTYGIIEGQVKEQVGYGRRLLGWLGIGGK